MKRGSTWSYVIRVTDTRTWVSKPQWVEGFAMEAEAKEARDSARVAARQGVYVDKSRITVTKYLGDWLNAHALEIKAATLATHRYLVKRYLKHRAHAAASRSADNAQRTVPGPPGARWEGPAAVVTGKR